MPQNRFRPVNEAHAIAEQVIYFQFNPPLSQELPALLSLKDELQSELPSSEILKTIQVDFSGSTPVHQDVKDAAGLVLSRFSPNGSIAWRISITPEAITFHCTDYTRWAEVWEKQKNYIRIVFSKMHGTKSFLSGAGIKIIDQFIFDGSEAEYQIADLLREGSPHLNPRAYASGSRWHCHTGWFDGTEEDKFKILNQLNVDSGLINRGGHIVPAVTIDHNSQVGALKSIDQLAEILPVTEQGLKALSDLMATLHDGNKRVLADLLNDSWCAKIALGVE